MRFRNAAVCAVVVAAAVIATYAVSTAKPDANSAAIERGAYLVGRVGMCADCHTEMTPTGGPNLSKVLAGAPIMFKPTVPLPKWGDHAPNLTPGGFVGRWTDAQLISFLETGISPRGEAARPPMPQYRLDPHDAADVTAYLRSLPAIASPRPPREGNRG